MTTDKLSSPIFPSSQFEIKILLIDDQAIVGETVRKMLDTEKDIILHFCQDPTQALKTAFTFEPTLILQDLVMPDVDGLMLVRFFRAHPALRDIPLIVMSSKEEAITKAEAFALGVDDYLVKLPDRIELIARIRHHSKGYINLLQRNDAYNRLRESERALAKELAQAAEYVVSLLPSPIEKGIVQTAWRYYPSAQLGGDSFGYHWIDSDHFAVYLLDVCGHGVGSALLSVSVLNALKTQSLPNTDFRIPESVLGALNETFPMENHNNLYFTIWYGVYNGVKKTLTHVSGGHPPALLVKPSGELSEIVSKNLIPGTMPQVVYEAKVIDIPTPLRLYVFSDGVYEVHNAGGEMWGFKRLKEYVSGAQFGVAEIDVLYKLLLEWCGRESLEDDFSLVCVDFS